jgi:hypothetical protein
MGEIEKALIESFRVLNHQKASIDDPVKYRKAIDSILSGEKKLTDDEVKKLIQLVEDEIWKYKMGKPPLKG